MQNLQLIIRLSLQITIVQLDNHIISTYRYVHVTQHLQFCFCREYLRATYLQYSSNLDIDQTTKMLKVSYISLAVVKSVSEVKKRKENLKQADGQRRAFTILVGGQNSYQPTCLDNSVE